MKTVFRGLVIASMLYSTVGLGVAGFAIATGGEPKADAKASAESGASGAPKAKAKTKSKGDNALPFEVLDRAVLWPLRIFD